MGVSYNAGVILGVSLSDIGFKIEAVKEQFEVHDKKGVPTGKFEYEHKTKLSFQNKETIIGCFDPEEDIKKFLGIEFNKNLKIITIDYDDLDADTIFIGKIIVQNRNRYWCVEEINDNEFQMVYENIKAFTEVKPKKYFYVNLV